MLDEEEGEWFKQGTAFIRQETERASAIRNSEFLFLKEYTYVMIDFLKMRE